MPTVLSEIDRVRARLYRLDQQTLDQLSAEYQKQLKGLATRLEELTKMIAEAESPKVSWLVNQERYRGFIADYEREIRAFLVEAGDLIPQMKAAAVGTAQRDAEELAVSQLTDSAHGKRLAKVLLDWKESPAAIRDLIQAEIEGWSLGSKESFRGEPITRKEVHSLIWEMQTKARENPVTLYRGSPRAGQPGVRSWTESRERAAKYAARTGGVVEEAKPGSLRGLRFGDYLDDPYKEVEWVIPDEKTMNTKVAAPVPDEEVFVRGTFTRANPRWVAFMSQRTKTGTPLGRLLEKAAGDGVEKVKDTLISGVARGQGIRPLAQDVARAAQMPLQRALTISRTEIIGAARDASSQSIRASQVVRGWVWDAALDERTCIACWEMNGESFPDTEPLDSHVNCRCIQIPETMTWEELGLPVPDTQPSLSIPPGRDEFAKLPSATQRSILGPTRYDAYQQGKVTLSDMVRRTSSPVWGKGLRQATVSELGL